MTANAVPDTLAFTQATPPGDAIPAHSLAVHTVAVLDANRAEAFQYAPGGRYLGDPALREQLGRLHGTDPDSIFVGTGSLQVLDLLTALLLRSGSRDILVEAPGYDRALDTFGRHGARILGVPMEPDGLDVEVLRRRVQTGPPAFLYTVPDFQNPTGVTLSGPKRRAVLDLAERYGFAVVEDVTYRELRYHGTAPPPLSGPARVITVGSLSAVLSPGLRVGYAMSDRETAHALAGLAEGTYLSPVPLCQAVAARCLASDVLRSSIGRVRHLLRPRHDAAVAAVHAALPGGLLAVPDGGYYLGVRVRVGADEPTFLATARAEGLVLSRGSAYHPPGEPPTFGTHFLRLPFHTLTEADFAYGVERLSRVCAQIS